MSVHAGTTIKKKDYAYCKEISSDCLLTIFGITNKEYNVGKNVSVKMAHSFVGTSTGLYLGGFLKNHRWNVEYETLHEPFGFSKLTL